MSNLLYGNRFVINGAELSLSQKKHFNIFYFLLRTANKAKIVYRGDTDIYHYQYFDIGGKGKYFKRNSKSATEIYIDKTNSEFKLLFDLIKNAVEDEKVRYSFNLNPSNQRFVNYFRIYGDQKDFVKSIERLNESEKLRVRDYYLRFLHQVDKYRESFFLSASYSYEIAERFAEHYPLKDNAHVVFAWICKPYHKYIFDNKNKRMGAGGIISKLNLPLYSILSHEREISFKGGIIPHLILGVKYLNDNTFYVNPAMFSDENKDKDKCINQGFKIDQTDFPDVVMKYGYERYLSIDENGMREINLKD